MAGNIKKGLNCAQQRQNKGERRRTEKRGRKTQEIKKIIIKNKRKGSNKRSER